MGYSHSGRDGRSSGASWWRFKRLVFLLELSEYKGEITYDFATIYNLLPSKIEDYEEAFILLNVLQSNPSSRYAAKQNGWAFPIASSDIFLWDVVEILSASNWDEKKNGKFKRKRRPWEKTGNDFIKGSVVPMERGRKLYAIKRLGVETSLEDIKAHNIEFMRKQNEGNK